METFRGNLSESEGEDMAEDHVTLPQDLPGVGNIRRQQSAIKLTEVRNYQHTCHWHGTNSSTLVILLENSMCVLLSGTTGTFRGHLVSEQLKFVLQKLSTSLQHLVTCGRFNDELFSGQYKRVCLLPK